MKILNLSIDLKKITKSLIKDHANGAKYYNFQVFLNDEVDKYGNNCSIAENQTKEQQAAKEKKNYIGNGKVVYDSGTKAAAPAPDNNSSESSDLDLPF